MKEVAEEYAFSFSEDGGWDDNMHNIMYAFIDGAEWATNDIFDWLEEKDLLTDDKSVIKEEWAKKNNY